VNVKGGVTPLLTALVVLVISINVHPEVFATLKVLGQAGDVLLSPDRLGSFLQQAGTPLAGEEVLPPPVRAMIHLIRSNQITSFSYSKAIGANEEIRQRLLEGAFPARYVPGAAQLLLVSGEQAPPSCKAVAAWGGVLLVHCP
jgi:hypothetical protein